VVVGNRIPIIRTRRRLESRERISGRISSKSRAVVKSERARAKPMAPIINGMAAAIATIEPDKAKTTRVTNASANRTTVGTIGEIMTATMTAAGTAGTTLEGTEMTATMTGAEMTRATIK
jgi:hypothetical protein